MKRKQLIIASLAVGLTAPSLWAQQPAVVTSPVAIPVAPVVAPKAPPEPTGLADIIRAKFPLAVAFKEFGFGWRELNWNGDNYLTKGETHWLVNHEYLIAYKISPRELRRLGENDYIAAVTGNGYPFAPDDRFDLTLLPMMEMLSVVTHGATGLRSFDPARTRTPFDARNASNGFNQSLSLVYLRKIAEAINGYVGAYLDTMPPLESAFAARQALLPYAENAVIFTQPGTTQPFKVNPLFSQRKKAHIRSRGRAVLFYEAAPAADGLRAVLHVNGTVRRVDEKSWKKLQEISELN